MPPWYNLPKTADDNTTIDAEIAAAIATHNADPTAHLAEDEAIEAHRTNEVIDHPAESIVNDKLRPNIRAYQAVVDPTDAEAYDTIDSAIAYVISIGGGNVLIMPGTHYLGTDIDFPSTVNLYGIDTELCIVVGGGATNGRLVFTSDTGTTYPNQYIENLTFESDGGYVLANFDDTEYSNIITNVSNCNFVGDGEYFNCTLATLRLFNCYFEITGNDALFCENRIVLTQCRIQGGSTSGVKKFIIQSEYGLSELFIEMYQCQGLRNHADGTEYMSGSTMLIERLVENNLARAVLLQLDSGQSKIMANTIEFKSTGYLNIASDENVVIGNNITAGSGNRIRLASGADNNIVTGNIPRTAITNSGSNNTVANNVTS